MRGRTTYVGRRVSWARNERLMDVDTHVGTRHLLRPIALAVAAAVVVLGLLARILPAWGQAPSHPPRAATLSVTLTVVVGKTQLGDLSASVTRAGKLVAVDGKTLITYLRPIVLASKLAELQEKIDAEGMIPVEDA